MQKILLAQPKLDASWQDLSVGEPHLIRDILLEEIDLNQCFPVLDSNDFIYPSPCGYDKLVQKLEEKHGHKVIVTNGAKQGLGAAFYAAAKLGKVSIGTHSPYWALLPALANLHGLNFVHGIGFDYHYNPYELCELMVSPNNPDGLTIDLEDRESICAQYESLMIHDAAYYTGIYMKDLEQKVYGDVQVYSISKMFGLSSLRLGYVVCKNEEMYNHIQYYMEHMTVGVSKLPQMLLLNIMNSIDMSSFESKCFNALEKNKEIVKDINPNIMEVPKENVPGMFLWGKVKDIDFFKRAKLHVIDGEPFGAPGFVRINLAFKENIMQDIVNKLNNVSL